MRHPLVAFVMAAAFLNGCDPSTGPTPQAPPGQLVAVTTGALHACAVDETGRAWCWGDNSFGQTGRPPAGCQALCQSQRPALVATSLRFNRISAAGFHTCGLTVAGIAYCWGDNTFGQLGSAGTGCRQGYTCRDAPAEVDGEMRFSSIVAGETSTCGLTYSGVAKCWGAFGIGGDFAKYPTPVTVMNGSDSLWSAIGPASFPDGCGISPQSVLMCWGSNSFGQLGTGSISTAVKSPVAIPVGKPVRSVGISPYYKCALDAGGDAYCWGYGVLGIEPATATACGPDECYPSPIKVAGGFHFTAISVGPSHVCGIDSASRVARCWGTDRYGSLGINAIQPVSVPLPTVMAAGIQFSSISVGSGFTCGVAIDKNAYCWGASASGQLSSVVDVFSLGSPSPVRVILP